MYSDVQNKLGARIVWVEGCHIFENLIEWGAGIVLGVCNIGENLIIYTPILLFFGGGG